MQDAEVIGVVTKGEDGPRVTYLAAPRPVRPEEFPAVPQELRGHVLRLAGHCEEGRCAQFANGRCSLGDRVARLLEPVVDRLPPCRIRSTCRWHSEQGDSICFRCPQVVTQVSAAHGVLASVAVPPGSPAAPDLHTN